MLLGGFPLKIMCKIFLLLLLLISTSNIIALNTDDEGDNDIINWKQKKRVIEFIK